MYQWFPVKNVKVYLPDIIKQNVSEVARSKDGFLTNYLKHGSSIRFDIAPGTNMTWAKKRELFIKRTLPAYLKNPTERRRLSLIAWAYNPLY